MRKIDHTNIKKQHYCLVCTKAFYSIDLMWKHIEAQHRAKELSMPSMNNSVRPEEFTQMGREERIDELLVVMGLYL